MAQPTKSRLKRNLIRSLIVLTVMAVVFSIYGFDRIWSALNRSYHPIERLDRNGDLPGTGSEPTSPKADMKPIAILLLGIDKRTYDIGRTDTMILAILDPKNDHVTLTSLPRDTYVEIADKNFKTKVNGAYQFGIPTVIATVEDFFKIPIDYYATIDFEGFVKAVDEVGGIEVNVDENMKYTDRAGNLYIDLKKGPQTLTGIQALGYSRFRHDAKGDIGRTERQQQVIRALIDKSTNFRSATKLFNLIDIIGDDLATDLTPRQMVDIAGQFRKIKGENVESIPVKGTPDRFGRENLWYYVVNDEERARLHAILKARLDGDIMTTEPPAVTAHPNETVTSTVYSTQH